jgi:hypothetical protein
MARRGPKPPQMRIILMTTLDRDTAKNIAEIMTTYMVWDSIASDALDDPEKTNDDYRRYRAWSYEAAVELADVYGIELPTITLARRYLRDDYRQVAA